MASSSLPFGYTQTPFSRKRNFAQMSSSHSGSSPYVPARWPSEVPSSSNESSPPSAPASQTQFPSLDNIRFPGDGLDYRRPARSSHRPETVIDLTDDTPPQPPRNSSNYNDASTSRATRPPRFDRDIIDVDDLPVSQPRISPPAQPQAIDLTQDDTIPQHTAAPRTPSPEVEFLSSRQILNRTNFNRVMERTLVSPPPLELPHHHLRRQQHQPRHQALAILNREAHNRPTAHLRRHVQSLTGLRSSLFPSSSSSSSSHGGSRAAHPTTGSTTNPHRTATATGSTTAAYIGVRPPTPGPDGPLEHIGVHISPEDFQLVAFDLGIPGGDGRGRNGSNTGAGRARGPMRAPSPPPEAREGFTRSPLEEDVLVCPLCGDELGAGEGDVKCQVWIVKTCGHVYCGACAHGRGSAKRKGKEPADKGKGKAKQSFTSCVVEGCNKKVSGPRQMFQLFL
ncbi:MAG: hypothetical protein M1822_001884 [Bathelium mastoideum]|nr:MAG: hypothetical protein M1822_001884 [Bathelium mastoideum]